MAGFLTVILLLMVSQLATSARFVKRRATLNDNNERRSDEVQHKKWWFSPWRTATHHSEADTIDVDVIGGDCPTGYEPMSLEECRAGPTIYGMTLAFQSFPQCSANGKWPGQGCFRHHSDAYYSTCQRSGQTTDEHYGLCSRKAIDKETSKNEAIDKETSRVGDIAKGDLTFVRSSQEAAGCPIGARPLSLDECERAAIDFSNTMPSGEIFRSSSSRGGERAWLTEDTDRFYPAGCFDYITERVDTEGHPERVHTFYYNHHGVGSSDSSSSPVCASEAIDKETSKNEAIDKETSRAELEFSIRKPNACTPGLFRRLSLDECEQAATYFGKDSPTEGKGGPQEETDDAKPAGCYVPLQPSAIPSRHLDFRYNHHEVGSADSYSFPVCTSGEAIDKEASRVVDSGCGTEAWEQAWETAFMTGLRDECPEYKFQSAVFGEVSPVCAAACELIAEIAAKLGVQLLGCTAQGRGCHAHQGANSDGSIGQMLQPL